MFHAASVSLIVFASGTGISNRPKKVITVWSLVTESAGGTLSRIFLHVLEPFLKERKNLFIPVTELSLLLEDFFFLSPKKCRRVPLKRKYVARLIFIPNFSFSVIKDKKVPPLKKSLKVN